MLRFQRLATILFSGTAPSEGAACALSPRRARALARRRHAQPVPCDLAHALAQVLGADDTAPEPTTPFEETTEPTPETWDIGQDDELSAEREKTAQWNARAQRIKLYDALCIFFRPSMVPPKGDITDLVML